MQFPRRQLLHWAAGAAAAVPVLSRLALAEEAYPARPIRLIIGFTAGAASDVTGRLFGKGAEPVLGQRIVAENKPGAGSSIAAQYVARADHDGYTILLVALSTLTNEIVNPSGLDINKDFAPIAPLAEGPFYLTVTPTLNVHSVAEFVALAKAKPGELLFGSVGNGSMPHLCAELFAQRTGIKMTHVTYPGSPQITTDLLAGRIAMGFQIGSSVFGQIQTGQLLALATTGGKRSGALPDVPTMAEAGVPDFDVGLWLGLLAPAATPRPIVDTLADAAHKAMHAPDIVDGLHKQGYEPLDAGPDEFAKFIRSETARWADIARAAGVKS